MGHVLLLYQWRILHWYLPITVTVETVLMRNSALRFQISQHGQGIITDARNGEDNRDMRPKKYIEIGAEDEKECHHSTGLWYQYARLSRQPVCGCFICVGSYNKGTRRSRSASQGAEITTFLLPNDVHLVTISSFCFKIQNQEQLGKKFKITMKKKIMRRRKH